MNNFLINNPPKITDDRAEMSKIGRQLFESMPNIYNDRVTAVIRRNVDRYMPKADSIDKDNAFFRSIYDYWVYGNSVMEEFYYDFPNKSHAEKSEYFVMHNRIVYVDHLNDKQEADELLENKYNTYKLLHEYYKRDMILIEGAKDWKTFLAFIDKNPVFVVKPINFGLGINVRKDSINNYRDARELFNKLLLERQNLSKDMTRDHLLQIKADVDIILEGLITADSEIARLHPASVNVLRMTTVRVGNEISIFYPRIKIGQHGNFADNAGAGGLAVGIDIETGKFNTDAFDELIHFNNPLEYHPDTNIKFRGFQVPHWNEAVALAKELARKFENVNYIGWDLALTPEGWVVVEGNNYGDFAGSQLTCRHGLKREFEELIDWRFDKQFWWE